MDPKKNPPDWNADRASLFLRARIGAYVRDPLPAKPGAFQDRQVINVAVHSQYKRDRDETADVALLLLDRNVSTQNLNYAGKDGSKGEAQVWISATLS